MPYATEISPTLPYKLEAVKKRLTKTVQARKERMEHKYLRQSHSY